MSIERLLINQPHDHLMANTWRLIFERRIRLDSGTPQKLVKDFSALEQLLPEYRLIGHSLACAKHLRCLD